MPYYNPAPAPQRNTNYIEYIDAFSAEGVIPSCGIRNFILMFDNFDGRDTLSPLTASEHKLYQMTAFYLLRGTVVFDLNGKEITVKAGQLMTTMPENMLKVKSISPDVRYFMYVVYPKVVSLTFNDLGYNYTNAQFSRAYFVNDVEPERLQYCEYIYDTMKTDMLKPPYEFKLLYQRSWLNVLLVQNFITHDFDIQSEGDSNSRQYDVYCRFLEALNKYSSEHRSVQYYADYLGISSKYLSFVCISYSKKNASSWIDEYVAQKAKVLMTVHNYTFTEVSEALHFQTVSSFSRYFKRVTGVTPKEYMLTQR